MSALTPPPLIVNRSAPPVWIRKLALYRSTTPPDLIRSISLRRGLNIVHGTGDGHSVGKSTLCRLLRYCLGEERFCDQTRRSDFKMALEHGAVAAEVMVGNRVWAIVRPLAGNTHSRALPDATIDDVLAVNPAVASWSEFQAALSAVTVADHAAVPLADGRPIAWLDVLAVCTRDQDSRLDDVLTWRPHQPLTVPDSSLVLRTVLGLLSSDEANLRRTVEQLERERASLLQQLQQAETLARTRFVDHWTRLRDLGITSLPADDAWKGSMANVDGVTDVIGPHLIAAEEADSFGAELSAANDRVQAARIAERDATRLLDQLSANRQLAEAKRSGDAQGIRQALSDLRRRCDAGETCSTLPAIPLRDCDHVKRKLSTGNIAAADAAQEEQEYRREVSAIERQAVPARAQLAAAISERGQAERQVGDLWRQRQQTFKRFNELSTAATALAWSLRVRDGTEPDLEASRSRLSVVEADLERARDQRNALLREARDARSDVQALYHWIVRVTGGPGYRGTVDFDEQRIRFEIETTHAGGGLAYRTMAVPYADFAALLRGISGPGLHPGILIHDSPREADANERLYHSLFRLAHRLETDLTPAGQEPPFQYIITTTTAPPTDMQADPWLVLCLAAEPESELLFRKQIAFPRQETILP